MPPKASRTSKGEPTADDDERSPGSGHSFEVHLEVFSGPFDLLLSLIAKRKLDITEVALAEVTDEFVAYIRHHQDWDLSQASEFLVIAATLLDLKAARLLPAGASEDPEDLELLEARDLLFARLLQYRAFKEVAAAINGQMKAQSRWHPRIAPMEQHFVELLPELVWSLGPEEFAVLAAKALTPREPTVTGIVLDHLHAPAVSVREQAALVAGRLRSLRAASFRDLVADAGSTLIVVARFLALLELFRQNVIGFDQIEPLGELTIRWSANDDADTELDDIDDYHGTVDAEEDTHEHTGE